MNIIFINLLCMFTLVVSAFVFYLSIREGRKLNSVFFTCLNACIIVSNFGYFSILTSRTSVALITGVKIYLIAISLLMSMWLFYTKSTFRKLKFEKFIANAILGLTIIVDLIIEQVPLNDDVFDFFSTKFICYVNVITIIILLFCFYKYYVFMIKNVSSEKKIAKYNLTAIVFFLIANVIALFVGEFLTNILVILIGLSFVQIVFIRQILEMQMVNRVPLGKEIVMECMNEGFLAVDYNNYILDCNNSSQKIFEELDRRVLPLDVTEVPFLWTELINGSSNLEFEKSVGGEIRNFRITISTLPSIKKSQCYGMLIYDITELQVILNKYKNLANIDYLTEISNRRFFLGNFDREIKRASNSVKNMYLLLYDLDHFKRINDTYGHICGDYVLHETTKIVKKFVNESSFFGRYGGEEFSVLFILSKEESIKGVVEGIREAVASHFFRFEGQNIQVSISGGVVPIEMGSEKVFADYISECDNLMYNAKDSGRNKMIIK